MSVCYNINCHDCKESLWIGQRDHIYTTEEILVNLNKFLFKHKGHKLSFDDDNKCEFYKEMNGDDGN